MLLGFSPRFWKFNNSLLYDRIYVQKTKECIKNTLNQYMRPGTQSEDPNSIEKKA